MRTLLTRAFPKASEKVPEPIPVPVRKPDIEEPTQPAAPAYTASMSQPVIRTRALAAYQPPAAAPPSPGSQDGGFHIQIGAFSRHSDAQQVLSEVTARAQEVVDGHAPLMVPLEDRKRQLIRARFAGFSEDTARTACSQLKARSIACVVMRAE
ncbi:MAG: SPOR domain-containing protein [Pseudomonadota bacterium]|nr:SPOR domain-containing protein [Pseudomonadota bacterium]